MAAAETPPGIPQPQDVPAGQEEQPPREDAEMEQGPEPAPQHDGLTEHMQDAENADTLGDMTGLHFAARCRTQQPTEERRLKRRTSEEGAADAADVQAADWFQEALQDSLKTFGGHVQKRLVAVETRVGNTEKNIANMQNDVKQLNQNMQGSIWELRGDLEKNQKVLDNRHECVVARQTEVAKSLQASATKHREQEMIIAEMQARIARLENVAAAAQGTAPGATANREEEAPVWPQEQRDHNRAPDHEMRTSGKGGRRSTEAASSRSEPAAQGVDNDFDARLARMGNLGWDDTEATLMARAQELLTSIQMLHKVVDMKPAISRQGTGSGVDVMWATSSDLVEAKIRIKCKGANWSGRVVWMDRKKSRLERRPARIIHKTAEILESFEWDRPNAGRVDKNVGSKYISVDGVRMFYTLRGALMHTVHASLRSSADEIDQIRGFAQED